MLQQKGGGIDWELYRHKTAVFSQGVSPRQRPPSGSRCQVIPCTASTPCRVTSGPSI
jgi:hypothetical protein